MSPPISPALLPPPVFLTFSFALFDIKTQHQSSGKGDCIFMVEGVKIELETLEEDCRGENLAGGKSP